MDQDKTNKGSDEKSRLVFISYAREDEKAARRLYNDLKSRGLNPWLDKESLLPGQNWENEIRKAIKKSRYFIPLFSSTSVEKRGYIQKEFKYALDVLDEFPESEIFVIPARLDNCDIPYEKLQKIEYVNLFPNWKEGLRKISLVMMSAQHIESNQNQKSGLLHKFTNKRTISILSIVIVLAISAAAFVLIRYSDNNNYVVKHDRINQIPISPGPRRSPNNILDIKNFLTYTNSTYGIKMQYPSDWVETVSTKSLHNIIVAFHPANSSIPYPASISVSTNYPDSLNLTEYAEGKWNQFRQVGSLINVKLTDLSTKSTLGGLPAYKIVYTLGKYNSTQIGTIIGPRSFDILILVEQNSSYWPIMQKMIDSFKVYNMTAATTSKFTAYTNSTYGIKMQYPSDWIKRSVISSSSYIPIIDVAVPVFDPLKLYQASVRMGIEKISSQNLKEFLNHSINAIRSTPNYVDIKVIKNDTSVTLDGHPAFKIQYVLTYSRTGVIYEGTRIGSIIGNKAYAITAISDADKYSSYWPIMQKMIDSIHFYNSSTVAKTNYQTYTNSTYGIKMQYPSDWIKNETFDNGRILNLDSPATNRFGTYVAEVRLNIDKSPASINLGEYLKLSILNYKNDPSFKNFKVIENDTHSTLGSHPAYKIIFTHIDPDGVDKEGLEVGTLIGSNAYFIQSLVDSPQYPVYLPALQKMIDSFHKS